MDSHASVSRTPNFMPTPEHIAELERLGDRIAEMSAHLDAAIARVLDLIREFDARGGWGNGFRSCAEWLSWRVGLNLGAARERVRVARALGTLPRLAQALARGQLSYAKVRALTRVATPETEERLLVVGRSGTASHVERIVRGWRAVDRRAELLEAAKRHATRSLHVYQDDDGMVIIRGRLGPEEGAVFMQALAAAREALYQRAREEARDADVSAETRTSDMAADAAHARSVYRSADTSVDDGAPGGSDQVSAETRGSVSHFRGAQGALDSLNSCATDAALDGVSPEGSDRVSAETPGCVSHFWGAPHPLLARSRPLPPQPPMEQQQADALALLAETALHRGMDPGAPGER